MGCGASSQSKACANEQFDAAVARFPADPVEGPQEKLGMGKAEKQFDNLNSFTWTLGGTGEVKIGKVQNVTLNKTPKKVPKMHFSPRNSIFVRSPTLNASKIFPAKPKRYFLRTFTIGDLYVHIFVSFLATICSICYLPNAHSNW